MKTLLASCLLLSALAPSAASASEGPCAENALRLYEEATGKAPSQFSLSAKGHNAWADAEEYIYVAANGMGSAYVIEYFHLDGRRCFLNSMRYDGDL